MTKTPLLDFFLKVKFLRKALLKVCCFQRLLREKAIVLLSVEIANIFEKRATNVMQLR